MLPLEGFRVLDLMTLSGYAGMELADYGAEVIKIEAPGEGDPLRKMLPLKKGASPHQAFRDRGKKSITLNLWSAEGQKIFKELVQTADVVLENFPIGTLEAIGLGYEDIAKEKPSIVYGRTTGYGSKGEGVDFPQIELIAQAKAGSMHVTGFPENPPTRIGFSIGEKYSASFLSAGITLALMDAMDTGLGQLVETSLCGTLAAISEDKVITYSATGDDPMRTGNAHPNINPYDILKCKDGYVAIGASSDDQWKKLAIRFGKPEWATDEKYHSNSVRGYNYFGDLRDKLEDLLADYTMKEFADICDEILIPGTMCGTTEQALGDPQLKERNMIHTVKNPAIGDVEMPGRPVKFLGTVEKSIPPAPILGANNAEIYASLDIDASMMSKLQEKGVI